MRQKILAHLTELMEEEKVGGGYERQALARALQGRGDPAGPLRDLRGDRRREK